MSEKIAERVRLFNIVRDIPYYIAVGKETDFCCATKPDILKRLLKSIGLKSRDVTVDFRWERLGLPEWMLRLPHEAVESHGYLEVWIPERKKWVVVDPTWDARIRHPKFHINRWDGLSGTRPAVIVERVWTRAETQKLLTAEEDPNVRAAYLKKNAKFFRAFNRWLEQQRRPI